MPSLSVLRVLFRELSTRERSIRINEPDLVMDDPEKVAAYTRAGRIDGVMAPMYLFHCAQICDVIRPGDQVLDLACGPATQLTQIAEVNPDVRFQGIDLSPQMLDRADGYIKDKAIKNIELRLGDISKLDHLKESSVDAVISTLAFHHLPDTDLLERTFAEVARVLKPGGGIYIVDFGHLKSEKSINYFAHQYADRQSQLFTLDYLNSLKAAFSLDEIRQASAPLRDGAKLYSTFLSPYLVALKSQNRRGHEAALAQKLKSIKAALPNCHKKDFNDLKTFFSLGGLKAQLLQ